MALLFVASVVAADSDAAVVSGCCTSSLHVVVAAADTTIRGSQIYCFHYVTKLFLLLATLFPVFILLPVFCSSVDNWSSSVAVR